MRTIGLSPRHIGTIVEPPCVSKVPPSPDGETFHEFVVGKTQEEGVPVAMDCSFAQFGIAKYQDIYAIDKLASYLKALGNTRMLTSSEKEGLESAFVDAKCDATATFAIKTLESMYYLKS